MSMQCGRSYQAKKLLYLVPIVIVADLRLTKPDFFQISAH